jgi:hypothetical protein
MARTKTSPPPDAPKNKGGRPREYDRDKVLPYVFEQLSQGKSLRRICADPERPDIPEENTVRDWCEAPELSAQYARARERGVLSRAEQISDLAASATPENVQVVKLQVETLKWEACKLLPKIYGERQQIEHSGKIESITVNVVRKEPPK